MVLIAGVLVNPLLIALLGVITGIMASVFRVGGALITVPFLILLNIPIITITATQPVIMFLGALLSVILNAKSINFSKHALKINGLLATGLVLGVFTGFELLKHLAKMQNFKLYFTYSYILITAFFGCLIIRQSFTNKEDVNNVINMAKVYYSKAKVVFSGILTSLFAVMLGLGGNVFLMPLFSSFVKLPIAFTKNNSYISLLILTGISSVFAILQLNSFSFTLTILTFAGILAGTLLGSFINKRISYNKTRIVPGLILVVVSCIMSYRLFYWLKTIMWLQFIFIKTSVL